MISRIAPTPNGEIHWGNLYNFLLTWGLTKRQGGKILLRFDDMDQDRCLEKYKEQVRELFELLSLKIDGEFHNQHLIIDNYRQKLNDIPHYVCECSRKAVFERTGDYHYDGHCRDKKLVYKKDYSAIRFRSSHSVTHDFVLWRKEDLPAYHLTSLCDDERMQVTHIFRGKDLLESSEIQLEISKAMKTDPLSKIQFYHHDLLTDRNGEKLSKTRGDGGVYSTLINMNKDQAYLELSKRLNLHLKNEQDLLVQKFDCF